MSRCTLHGTVTLHVNSLIPGTMRNIEYRRKVALYLASLYTYIKQGRAGARRAGRIQRLIEI